MREEIKPMRFQSNEAQQRLMDNMTELQERIIRAFIIPAHLLSAGPRLG